MDFVWFSDESLITPLHGIAAVSHSISHLQANSFRHAQLEYEVRPVWIFGVTDQCEYEVWMYSFHHAQLEYDMPPSHK